VQTKDNVKDENVKDEHVEVKDNVKDEHVKDEHVKDEHVEVKDNVKDEHVQTKGEDIEVADENYGLLAVVECDLPVAHVQKILADIGVGTVGPASVISSMGRDTNKTIVLLTRDLFEHLEIVDPELMGSITRVEEYDVSKCIVPNFKRGETFDIFCRLSNTRL